MTIHMSPDSSLAWLDSMMDHASPHGIVASSSTPSSSTSPITSVESPTSQSNPQTDASVSGSTQSLQARPNYAPPPAKPVRRRIRPKIALDASQPPTATGKPRARVYVACEQCRIRKTRCDGAKPVCFNCRKRPPEVGQCSYDAQPKRRGQDKVPGTRIRSITQRGSKKIRSSSKGQGMDGQSETDSNGHRSDHSNSQPQDHDQDVSSSDNEYDPFPLVDLDPLPSDDCVFDLGRYRSAEPSIPPGPSLQFTRETWWDALLTFYTTEESSTEMEIATFTPELRTLAIERIIADLRALFHSSIYWLSFINLPRFFDSLLNPSHRSSLQPSLVLAALAAGKFSQSSEAELGPRGRTKALKLLDLAHSSLQGSLASGWVDIGLVQAAWLLVYFEMQAHPRRYLERGRSSLQLLDSLIRLFSLTTLDADLIRAHVIARQSFAVPSGGTSFSPQANGIPGIAPSYMGAAAPGFFQFNNNMAFATGLAHGVPGSRQRSPITESLIPENFTLPPSPTPPTDGCDCLSLAMGKNFPSICSVAPTWAGTIIWPVNIPEGDFRKEECRRLVWSSVMVTATLYSYTSLAENSDESPKLWLRDTENFAILYPGEALAQYGASVRHNNIWTLYSRTMLLLHRCVAKRGDPSLDEGERAQFATKAWLEMDAIEDALNKHTCTLEKNLGFQAREILFSARMCVSHDFRRYIPQVTSNGTRLFYRDKAIQWLKNRMAMAERVWQNLLSGIQVPALDYRKPMLIYWFMSHVMKALILFRDDPTLVFALEASKIFIKRAEYLMMFWPSLEQRQEHQKLRLQIVEACLKAGISPPDSTLPGPIPRLRNDSDKEMA